MQAVHPRPLAPRCLRAVCAAALVVVLCAAAALPAAERPNVIFILADDLGWNELGSSGNTFNETPHLDRLAREGLLLTQAYAAAPVCSPTRAALLTGQWPLRVGITDYLGPQDKERFLKPGTPTLNTRLAAAGYRCGLVGKWHLTGDYDLKRGEPARHGWDEILCSETRYIGPGWYFPPYKHLPGVEPLPGREYLTDRLNHEAVAFIRRNKDRPFFLYLSHYAPHTRLDAPPALVAKYAAKPGAGKNRNNPTLAAMLERIDAGVGEILAELDTLGLARNTLLVFTSDNGGESNVTSNAPLRAGKSTLYEGGVRVACVARWPARIAAGLRSAEPVVTHDWHATILEAAGVPAPAAPAAPPVLDGLSLAPLFSAGGKLPERSLFWHYPLAKPHFLGGRSSSALRSGPWKLIEFLDTGALELYDLSADPGEQDNRAATDPARRDELHARLKAWRTATTP